MKLLIKRMIMFGKPKKYVKGVPFYSGEEPYSPKKHCGKIKWRLPDGTWKECGENKAHDMLDPEIEKLGEVIKTLEFKYVPDVYYSGDEIEEGFKSLSLLKEERHYVSEYKGIIIKYRYVSSGSFYTCTLTKDGKEIPVSGWNSVYLRDIWEEKLEKEGSEKEKQEKLTVKEVLKTIFD